MASDDEVAVGSTCSTDGWTAGADYAGVLTVAQALRDAYLEEKAKCSRLERRPELIESARAAVVVESPAVDTEGVGGKRRRTREAHASGSAVDEEVATVEAVPFDDSASQQQSGRSPLEDGEVGFITKGDLILMTTMKPWDDFYGRRPIVSHTFNYRELKPYAKAWVVDVIKSQDTYYRVIWKSHHCIRPDLCLEPSARPRCAGQTQAHERWLELLKMAEELIVAELLPADVLLEPFIWNWNGRKMTWEPETRALLEEIAVQNAKKPSRTFFVFDIAQHPFYTSGLSKRYPSSYPLPGYLQTGTRFVAIK